MSIFRRTASSLVAGVGFVLALGVTAAPAHAQATRTWVSGVGDDVNPCSRTAPCKTFAGAISKTAAGGEINCLDPGGFGGVTITKAISIICTGVQGGVLGAGTHGITVNAGANDRVVLQGLDIEGLSNGTSLNGINIIAGRDVIVINCDIRGFNSASSSGIRVANAANTTNRSRLTVLDSRIVGNTVGITVDSGNGLGNANVTNSLFTANTNASIRVSGAGNRASVGGNSFFGSPKALELLSGGTATSFGNNAFGTAATDAPTVTPLG
jgi:hypothetical protein